MARIEDQGLKCSNLNATATSAQNTAASATLAAPGVKSRLFITMISVSFDSTPSVQPDITLKSAANTYFEWVLPAAAAVAGAPFTVVFTRPIQCGVNEAVTLNCGGIGGTGKSYLNIAGFAAGE